MNSSLFEAAWKQLRVQIQAGWRTSSVPNDHLQRVAGNFDQFIGPIQVTYGYARQRAEVEFDLRRGSLREILEKRIEEEFRRRPAKIEARQKNDISTP